MPDLRQHRPAPAAARPDLAASTSPQSSLLLCNRWIRRAGSWLQSTGDGLARAMTGEPIMARFAQLAAEAREPEEVRVELVRLAAEISGAARVELFSDRAARRLASWPPNFPHETTCEFQSLPRGPITGPVGRAIRQRPGPFVLQIPLKAGDRSLGSLRLTSRNRRPWPARLIRRLTTLCAIASAAERGLARPDRIVDATTDSLPEPQGSTILAAFLTFAQAQARRRNEPLSLMEVEVDRLDSIQELLGDELAESAIERVSRAVKSTIRASDVVARLDGGRIAILLPNANPENALKVAETLRTAIARAGAASTTMPTLTASISVATYPDHAHDAASLRAAASSSLTRAKEKGYAQISAADPIPGLPTLTLNHRVG
jgi:diguanylate cyclase (GGDEF)-like protein